MKKPNLLSDSNVALVVTHVSASRRLSDHSDSSVQVRISDSNRWILLMGHISARLKSLQSAATGSMRSKLPRLVFTSS